MLIIYSMANTLIFMESIREYILNDPKFNRIIDLNIGVIHTHMVARHTHMVEKSNRCSYDSSKSKILNDWIKHRNLFDIKDNWIDREWLEKMSTGYPKLSFSCVGIGDLFAVSWNHDTEDAILAKLLLDHHLKFDTWTEYGWNHIPYREGIVYHSLRARLAPMYTLSFRIINCQSDGVEQIVWSIELHLKKDPWYHMLQTLAKRYQCHPLFDRNVMEIIHAFHNNHVMNPFSATWSSKCSLHM